MKPIHPAGVSDSGLLLPDALQAVCWFDACRGRRRVTGSANVPRPWPAAKSSSFISLRRSPNAALGKAYGSTAVEWRDVAGSGRWGALRSEIKEEDRAQPGPGDIRGAECPVGLIPTRRSRCAAWSKG